jgi:hypothetical protein
MVERVVTHRSPRHSDDFFALCLVKIFYKNVSIEEISPQDSRIPEFLNRKDVMLIDVGRDYNVELLNFDHHHDPELSCSLVLVADYFGLKLDGEFVRGIDYVDRFGALEGLKKAGIKSFWNDDLDRMRKTIILSEPTEELGMVFLETCVKKLPYTLSWSELFNEADKRGLLSKGKDAIEKEEKEFARKLSQVKIFEVDGLRVIYSPESLAPSHSKVLKLLDGHIIIEPDAMSEGKTAIVKNTVNPFSKYLDLSNVFNLYPKVFLHNTGFIAVVDVKISDVSINDIIMALNGEYPRVNVKF